MPVKVYQLTVHTFGLTSSPSVAGFALRRTAIENRTNASVKAQLAIQRYLYVDDLLISVEDSTQAVQLVDELSDLLASGGFQLTKYASNSREVLEAIPTELLSPQLHEVNLYEEEIPMHKTLGQAWDPDNDQLRIKVAVGSHPLTRRRLLSVLPSVYDPLEMVGPYMLPAKLLLQKLAKQELDWDTVISDADRLTLEKWLRALPCLNGLSVPRLCEGFSFSTFAELHCFTDASCDGYGAVCYFRAFDGMAYACSFIIGKSRVAPVKRLSTPRLELCAAVVAIKLSKVVKQEHDISLRRILYWSDSTTVLIYLRNTSMQRPVFEKNQILQFSTKDQWNWVDTDNNPADLYSRGVSPRQVGKSERWLRAPSFLLKEETAWRQVAHSNEVSDAERERIKESAATIGCSSVSAAVEMKDSDESATEVNSSIYSAAEDPLKRLTFRYSSLPQAVRSVSWLLRLKQMLRMRSTLGTSTPAEKGPINGKEYNAALLILIRLAQQQSFPHLVEALEAHPCHEVGDEKFGKLARTALRPLQKFCPIVADGVIRVGGRLQRSNLPVDFKHPIVLPKATAVEARKATAFTNIPVTVFDNEEDCFHLNSQHSFLCFTFSLVLYLFWMY